VYVNFFCFGPSLPFPDTTPNRPNINHNLKHAN
jgi:hypothetical protein